MILSFPLHESKSHMKTTILAAIDLVAMWRIRLCPHVLCWIIFTFFCRFGKMFKYAHVPDSTIVNQTWVGFRVHKSYPLQVALSCSCTSEMPSQANRFGWFLLILIINIYACCWSNVSNSTTTVNDGFMWPNSQLTMPNNSNTRALSYIFGKCSAHRVPASTAATKRRWM